DEPKKVVEAVVAALDAWALEKREKKRPEKEWRHLVRVAGGLDPSPQRRQLRALLMGQPQPPVGAVVGLFAGWPAAPALGELGLAGSWRRVQELRRRVRPEKEEVLTVLLLARACEDARDVMGAQRVLRRALAARPDQVVLLSALGGLLERQRPP